MDRARDTEWTGEQLLAFVKKAGESTWTAKQGKKLKWPMRPGCDEYLYEDENWRFHDSFAWDKDGGGEVIVYFKDEPIWIQNYFGHLIGTEDSKTVYGFLRKAMRETHPKLPIRGAPLEEAASGLKYEIKFSKAELGCFVGIERIYQNENVAYEGYFHGGFVT